MKILLTFILLISSLKLIAAENDSKVIVDYLGLTIYKNGKVVADSARWNLGKKGNRAVYTPVEEGKNFNASVEIARDENDKVVGLKQTIINSGDVYKAYFLENGLVTIENGKGKAYTADSCDKVTRHFADLKKCSDILSNMDESYTLSERDAKNFPEFESENILNGKKSKNVTTPSYGTADEVKKMFVACDLYYNYAGEKSKVDAFPKKAEEPASAMKK